MWIVIEAIGVNWLHLPIKDFAKDQFKCMSRYQGYLIEIGEREPDEESDWPPEARLLFFSFVNCVIMVVIKMVGDKIGDGMAISLKKIVEDMMSDNKNSDILKQAEEATIANPPETMPSAEPTDPLGGLGGLLTQFGPLLAGFLGNKEKPERKRKKKKPTGFASKRKPTGFSSKRKPTGFSSKRKPTGPR